jgi:hypothetical protein
MSREQIEGLKKLQPVRDAVPGTLLQLMPPVRCKLSEWRETTQHLVVETAQPAKVAVAVAVGEEEGDEGVVGGGDVEMTGAGAPSPAHP